MAAGGYRHAPAQPPGLATGGGGVLALLSASVRLSLTAPVPGQPGEIAAGLALPSIPHVLALVLIAMLPVLWLPAMLCRRLLAAGGAVMTPPTRLAIGLVLALCPVAALAGPQRFETPRSDGSAIHWTLDQLRDATGILLLAQGSGCQSAERNANLALTRAALPSFAALTVEKYGVAPGDDPANDHADCSPTFRRHHTITQRVEDAAAVLAALRGRDWWNGRLVLIGGSEGGDVIARLSARIEADAAILISTGGGKTFGEMVRQSITAEMKRHGVPRDRWPPVERIFGQVRANPQSSEVWAGSSFRFWADAIDRRIMDSMLESRTRFLLIQGGRDVPTPPELARMVADGFASAGRSNLTYWEFPALDHAMTDAQGTSEMKDVLAQAAAWLETVFETAPAATERHR